MLFLAKQNSQLGGNAEGAKTMNGKLQFSIGHTMAMVVRIVSTGLYQLKTI